MLGFYENFPLTIHKTEVFSSAFSKRVIQQKITKALQEVNSKTYSFEEIGNPAVPKATVIFEFGIADTDGFVFLTKEESERLLTNLNDGPLRVMDWFCSIRYYKNENSKRIPLKFDYYFVRLSFEDKGTVEVTVFHERGPRYLTPKDLISFIERTINQTSLKKVLKQMGNS